MITEQEIRDILKSTLSDVDISIIPVNGVFKEYRIDSLDFYSFIIALQDVIGKEISDADVDKMNCIADIIEYCNTH